MLRAENTLVDPEKKKRKEMMNTLELEKDKKRGDNIMKDMKKKFRLEKEINR